MSDEKSDFKNLTTDDPTSTSVPVPEPTGEVGFEVVTASKAGITFQGNNYDVLSIVGVTVGGVVLLSCVTLNFGWYCLPLISILLGSIGLAMAKDSVNPERTRLLSWISLGSGAAILALIIFAIVAYVVIIIAIAGSGGFQN